jgi:hypothetical protein
MHSPSDIVVALALSTADEDRDAGDDRRRALPDSGTDASMALLGAPDPDDRKPTPTMKVRRTGIPENRATTIEDRHG